MVKEKTAYQQIMKATSIFGGVQVFQIFIRIIRAKFVAVLLGPAGLGIAGLLGTNIQLITSLTNFGLGTSAVKEISAAFASGDKREMSRKTVIVRRWVWITGLLGSFITFFCAPWLSELTFGNDEYTYAFIWISITLLFNQISTGQNVILRGARKVKLLAQASVLGSILGLIATIPLYYFYGINGIVPGIIITSVTTLILSWYFSNKVIIREIPVSYNDTWSEGKDMLKLGFMVSLSGLITLGVSYIIRIYISREGGVDQVGFFSAGFSIINSYVGMIFTAMSTDYFPRLSGVSSNKEKYNLEINQQTEIAILILAPIVLVFMIYIKWGIILLYSVKFLPVVPMILWSVLGIIFKAGSWAIGYLFLAKGDRKLFVWNEVVFNAYYLIMSLLGYYFFGLKGLGMAFLFSYGLYMLQVFFVARKYYQFSFNNGLIKILAMQSLLGVLTLMTALKVPSPFNYLIGSFFICVSIYYAYKELDKRLDINSILLNFKNKFGGRK
jgi:O-antigen/teichoic acid export membrane protein